MTPLQPQTPQRIEWETKMIDRLVAQCECTRSDAQAWIEAREREVNAMYLQKLTAEQAADVLIHE